MGYSISVAQREKIEIKQLGKQLSEELLEVK